MGFLKRWQEQLFAHGYRYVRRAVISVVGMTVLVVGLAMIVLPGPAILVVPAGLAILALEFQWARRWLHKAKDLFQKGLNGNKPKVPPCE